MEFPIYFLSDFEILTTYISMLSYRAIIFQKIDFVRFKDTPSREKIGQGRRNNISEPKSNAMSAEAGQ